MNGRKERERENNPKKGTKMEMIAMTIHLVITRTILS